MDKRPNLCYNTTNYVLLGGLMPISFLPTYITAAATDLQPKWLQERGIRLLMLDFDNTIVPYTTDRPTPLMAGWLRWMQLSNIQVCVVSNSRNDRVRRFCAKHGVDCIVRAKKPGTKGIRECLERYGIPPQEAALCGDQIFTDTLGANRAGVRSILVEAIDNHNFWLKLRHVAEKPFIFAARKRRISHA